MYRLPLYPEGHETVVEKAKRKGINKSCTDCSFHKDTHTVCMPPIRSAPTDPNNKEVLLVVADNPRTDEDHSGQPFTSRSGQWIRASVEPIWKGEIIYTYGFRCAAAGRLDAKVTNDHIDACRGYLAGLIDAVKPTRILMVGQFASEMVLGRSPWPYSVRTGYAYLSNGSCAYFMPTPFKAMSNRFFQQTWNDDIDRALSAPLPIKPDYDAELMVIETEEDAKEAARQIKKHKSFAADTEFSGGLHTEYFEVDSFCLSLTGTWTVWCLNDIALNKPECVAPIKEVVEDPNIEFVAQNAKTEAKSLNLDNRLKFKIRERYVDTLVKRKLAHPDVDATLGTQAELIGMGGHKDAMHEEVVRCRDIINMYRAEVAAGIRHIPGTRGRVLDAAISYPGLEPDALVYGIVDRNLRDSYCGLDTVSTGFLARRTDEDLEDEGLQLVMNWMAQVPRAVSHIEMSGLLVDKRQVYMVHHFVTDQLTQIEFELAQDGLKEPSKADQVIEYLFVKHGLPIQGKTASGKPSVDKKALDKLPQDHRAVKLYMEWKKLETIRTRYSLNLLELIREDGRIHGNFNANGTETGRWSSNNPNLQNQPSRGPLAKMIKKIYVAQEGYTLIQCDLSQIEYRIAALISGDKNWTKAFVEGRDLHRRNAELASFAWGLTQEQAEAMTKEEIDEYRSLAKAVGFGLLYGKSVGSLAREWGVSKAAAGKVVDAIMSAAVELDQWTKDQHRFVYANGYVRTYIDGKEARKRPLFNAGSDDEKERAGAFRRAVNSTIQGSAADVMMRSLVEIVNWIEDDNIPARLVCTVHDSAIVEVRNDYLLETCRIVQSIMQSWWCGDIPLKSDLELGPSWGELKSVRFNKNGELVYDKLLEDGTEELVKISA